MGWIIVIATAVSLLMGGGAVYAADAAVPGDALYNLDLSLERWQLQLTNDAQARITLQLENAAERLEEAEALVASGEGDLVPEVVAAYGQNVSSIARNLAGIGGVDREELDALLDYTFSIHDARLATLLAAPDPSDLEDPDDDPVADDDEAEDGDEAVGEERCANWDGHTIHETHPMADRIADIYEVDSADVMTWFCEEGAGFGEIMRAYGIWQQLAPEDDPEQYLAELFAQREEGMGWGRIMQEQGLIGRPEGVPPGPPPYPGPPDHAGRPDHAGPPSGLPPGPPSDVPPGPPDHAGPPDDVPHGPPDHANPPGNGGPPDHAGPPDGVPKGPPAGVPKGPPGHGG